MRFVHHPDARAFLDRALPWLMEAEAEHNLVLGIARSRADGDPPGTEPAWFATVEEDGQVLGAAFRTPPHMLGLTRMPAGGVPLVTRMAAEAFPEIPGVVGPEEVVEPCVAMWAASHPVLPRLEMRMGIYVVEAVRPPARAVPGRMRPAETWEVAELIPWMEGFEADTGILSTGAADTVQRLVAARALYLWEVDDAPVSMAGASGATPNGVRVGYVYTSPEKRGQGYAAALTAALSQFLLDEGRRFCFLYTNLADPVSNGLYRRLGYELVAHATAYRFDAA